MAELLMVQQILRAHSKGAPIGPILIRDESTELLQIWGHCCRRFF